jgi:hypothetical protein
MIKGEIFIRCRGQRLGSIGRNGHRYVEDRGMVPRGACVIRFHYSIIVLPSIPKGEIID